MIKNVFIRRALLVLIAGLIAVAGAEAVTRLTYTLPWYEQLATAQWASQQIRYRRNQLGLRDRDYGPPSPGTRRVLILGDSFTYGFGVADEARVFPRLVEQRLNGAGLKVEILNGGISNSLTGQWIELLHKAVDDFKPDVVLAVFFLRDGTSLSSMGDFFGPVRAEIIRRNRASWIYQHFYLFRMIRGAADRQDVAERYTSRLIDAYLGNESETAEWRTAQANLVKISALSDQYGATFGLVIFPILVELDQRPYPFSPVIDEIARFASSQKWPLHNLLSNFAGHRGPELWVSSYDQHPNADGHAIAAQGLTPFVQQLLAR